MEQGEMSETETANCAAQPEPVGEVRDPQTPWEVFVATACTGKVAHDTARAAHDQYARERKRARRRTGKGRRPEREREPYRCKVCGKWHMGYKHKGKRGGR